MTDKLLIISVSCMIKISCMQCCSWLKFISMKRYNVLRSSNSSSIHMIDFFFFFIHNLCLMISHCLICCLLAKTEIRRCLHTSCIWLLMSESIFRELISFFCIRQNMFQYICRMLITFTISFQLKSNQSKKM